MQIFFFNKISHEETCTAGRSYCDERETNYQFHLVRKNLKKLWPNGLNSSKNNKPLELRFNREFD